MSIVKSNTRRRLPMWRNPMLTDPFMSGLMDSRRWNRFFEGDNEELEASPAINVKENEKDIRLELAAPGLSKDDFKVTLEEGVLTVSAEKQDKKEEEREGYVRKEFSYSSFTRSIGLPENVDEQKDIEATYKDGILRMKLHKKEGMQSRQPRSIKVT